MEPGGNAAAVRHEVGKVFALAVPAIFESIMGALIGIVNTAMVGSLGAAATAAAALNASPMWLMNALSMMVSGGATVLIARCYGSGDTGTAGAYARQALTMSALLGLLMTGVMLLVAPHFPVWMHAEPEVVPDAVAYMRIISLSNVPNFVALTLYGVVRGGGNTRLPMVVSILVNLLNVLGNLFLIYPSRTLGLFGGIRVWGANLGVRGAAISSVIAMGLAGVFMLFVMAKRGDEMRFTLRSDYSLKKQGASNILRIGTPIAAERAVISVGQILYMSVISSLGTVALSAHYLATTAESICYNPAYGFAAAAIIMVGQALGARDEQTAQRHAYINIILSVAVMVAVSALMYAFALPLIRLFTPDPAVCEYGASALRIVAFVEPLFAVAIVTSGALRGAGDAVAPLFVGIVCMLFVRLPFALFFVRTLNLGLDGAWYAMTIDLALRGILTLLRFQSGKWKKKSRRLAEIEERTALAASNS